MKKIIHVIAGLFYIPGYVTVLNMGAKVTAITYKIMARVLDVHPNITIIKDRFEMTFYSVEAMLSGHDNAPCKIDGVVGWYEHDADLIVIPTYRNIDLFMLINTVCHEMRHAWQQKHGWDMQDGSIAYNERPTEKDARRFGNIISGTLRIIFYVVIGLIIGLVINHK